MEELTQSIGLPADSKNKADSIFYEDQLIDNNIIKEYSQLDIDIIRLLYHAKMQSGLNSFQASNMFKRILKIEGYNYFGIKPNSLELQFKIIKR